MDQTIIQLSIDDRMMDLGSLHTVADRNGSEIM